jgi:FkbM family methyltransferase
MSIRLVTKSIWGNPGNRGKRLRKTLDAVAWQLQKRAFRSTRILKLSNGARFRAYPDCVVSSALIYADWPEYHELMLLRRTLSDGEVMIDVGANVGHISLLLSDVVGPLNVFAFEPTPVAFRRLAENWRLNGWPTDGLLQAAVGSKAGYAFVRDVDRPVTTNTVAPSPTDERSVEVPLVRLDDLRHLWAGRSIGLLKIDVEGYELEVFLGSRCLLAEQRPRLIMFESLAGLIATEISTLLTNCSYHVFQLNWAGRPDFIGNAAQNLFAVAKEYQDSILRVDPCRPS